MKAGDTFLIDQPGTSLDSHLWIVISDPMVDSEDVVIVNLTSWRADKDQACFLDVGDHPYVSHRSCVAYFGAKRVSVSAMEALVSSGAVVPHSAVTATVLQRIRMGVLDSKTCPMEIAECLANQGLIEL